MLLTKHRENLTLFERLLQEYGILYCRIRPAMPRHSGKLERSNRTDDLRFYSKLRMFSLPDGQKQLAVYQRKSTIMTCRRCVRPNEIVADYLGAVLMANGLPVLSARQAPLSIHPFVFPGSPRPGCICCTNLHPSIGRSAFLLFFVFNCTVGAVKNKSFFTAPSLSKRLF